MLDSKITELADRLIQIQFRERTEQLTQDLQRTRDEMTMAGMGTSGPHVKAVFEVCARDVELRALIVWQSLRRVLSQAGIVPSESLADDLKEGVSKYVEEIFLEPHGRLEKLINSIRIGYRPSLTNAREQAVAKVHAEIDLFVMRLTRPELQGESSAPVQLNITGNVGAVMTGPNANASISQVIGEQDREALIKALDMVQSQLEHVERLPAHPKEEIVEVIAETRAEAGKAKPNGTKLRSALTDISTAIQTVGSLNDAYQLLKTAVIPFGVFL